MVLAAIALVAGACSSSTSPSSSASSPPASTPATASSPAPTGAATVQATDSLKFTPATVTINVGQTVVWQNNGTVAHTVTFDSGPSFSQNLNAGANVVRMFSTAGTFKYHCVIHGAAMSGTVIVR
jgi:plastocyanin